MQNASRQVSSSSASSRALQRCAAKRDIALARRPRCDGATVALTVSSESGRGELMWHFPVLPGHALSVLRAMPRLPGSFALQAHDLAQQFQEYCDAHGFARTECMAITLLVDHAEQFDMAAVVGRRLGARTVRVVLCRGPEDVADSVQLIATFVKRLV